jgi:hypothetical protein
MKCYISATSLTVGRAISGAALGNSPGFANCQPIQPGRIARLFKKCNKKRKTGRPEFISPHPTPSGLGYNYTSRDIGVSGFTTCVDRPHAVGDMFALPQTGLAVLRYRR